MDQVVEDKNLKFMTDFVQKYSKDSHEAKQFYYQSKIGFDIDTPEGAAQRKRMLKKYLEGMQWVLFYYYKGSPHWRWYYPYLYAPMISDLGINIVNDFLGSKTITKFETDQNCPENTMPYTPFQQLLCIMPLKSFKLLPPVYRQVPETMLHDYPRTFEVDMNGKMNSWEAIVIIPFVEERKVIEEEKKLFEQGLELSDADKFRNSTAFAYHEYCYDAKAEPRVLPSQLR